MVYDTFPALKGKPIHYSQPDGSIIQHLENPFTIGQRVLKPELLCSLERDTEQFLAIYSDVREYL